MELTATATATATDEESSSTEKNGESRSGSSAPSTATAKAIESESESESKKSSAPSTTHEAMEESTAAATINVESEATTNGEPNVESEPTATPANESDDDNDGGDLNASFYDEFELLYLAPEATTVVASSDKESSTTENGTTVHASSDKESSTRESMANKDPPATPSKMQEAIVWILPSLLQLMIILQRRLQLHCNNDSRNHTITCWW